MANIIELVEKNLCVQDIDDFREEFGIDLLSSMETLQDGSEFDTKVLTGLIWIAKRHEDPDYTLEQAKREPIMSLVGGESEPNPTKAAPKKSGKKTPTVKRKRS